MKTNKLYNDKHNSIMYKVNKELIKRLEVGLNE